MAHAQKPDFVFRRNERVHLNRRGRQFSRLLAVELCTSACRVCTACASLCSAVMWRLLVTHSILLFPLHFSSRASPCAITFQVDSTTWAHAPTNTGWIQRRTKGEHSFVCLQIWKHGDGAVKQPQEHIRNPGQSDARLRQQRASRLRRCVDMTRHLHIAKLLSEWLS